MNRYTLLPGNGPDDRRVSVVDDPKFGKPRPDGTVIGNAFRMEASLADLAEEYPGWWMFNDQYDGDWVFVRESDGRTFTSCDLSNKDLREGFEDD